MSRLPSEFPMIEKDAFHGIFGDLVDVILPHTEADPVALLTNALVMFGNAVGSGPHVMVGRNPHAARHYVVQVGESSRARKGQAFADTRAFLQVADSEWHDGRVMSGLASGEGLIAAVRDPSDDDDTGSTDKRLCVFEPEFARVLKACGREGATLSAVVREAWDSNQLRVMTRRDPLVATGAHISLLTHITTTELTRNLGSIEAANGFANRFAFFAVQRSKRLPSGGNLEERDVLELGRAIRDRLADARRVGRVRRSDLAEDYWCELYNEIADNEPPGFLGAITARAEAQLLRFSLTYALADGAREIGTDHLAAAWALWRYSEASAAFIFADLTGMTTADKVLDVLIDAGPAGIAKTDLYKRFSGHVTARDLDAALDTLTGQSKAFSEQQPTAGRPRTVIFASGVTP